MRSGLAQAQERDVVRPVQENTAYPSVVPNSKEIPFDYVAKFVLTGKRGNRVQDVINISVEGAFIATSIGYGFVPKLPPLQDQGIRSASGLTPIGVTFPASLPDLVANFLVGPIGTAPKAFKDDVRIHLSREIVCLMKWLCGIDFKYSIVDSGTGRELQNQPIQNIAGLGKADGDRPFRHFPKPMTFLPRSTIRIEVEELSEGPLYAGAELQIVLHGYKMLG